ncbi:adenosylcobinamide-GDP ribazoletransferase [Caenimonas sp. SL110]|uniref:adenosylcobinamide-GDP ribazoletransferase n=1 Tax=Caenimonas sp. SL110 TaxID=1450524 RepID=UPI00069E8BF5|nr:adenosylcobinamide-GDP ribazoletransferase [Caenimonas sp. SL110]
MKYLSPYLAAVHHFTGLPIAAGLKHSAGLDGELPQARAEHYPGVGWLVGLAACVVFAVFGVALHASAFTPLVAALACLAATMAITHTLHEQAWASLFDEGKPGPPTRPILALVMGVIARLALLAVLAAHSPAAVLAALFAGHVVSRFWPLVLLRTLAWSTADAANDSLPLNNGIDNRALGIAVAWCLVPIGLVAWSQGAAFAVAGVLMSGLALLGLRQWVSRSGRGLDRTSFFASQLVCEIGFYVGAAAGLR